MSNRISCQSPKNRSNRANRGKIKRFSQCSETEWYEKYVGRNGKETRFRKRKNCKPGSGRLLFREGKCPVVNFSDRVIQTIKFLDFLINCRRKVLKCRRREVACIVLRNQVHNPLQIRPGLKSLTSRL